MSKCPHCNNRVIPPLDEAFEVWREKGIMALLEDRDKLFLPPCPICNNEEDE